MWSSYLFVSTSLSVLFIRSNVSIHLFFSDFPSMETSYLPINLYIYLSFYLDMLCRVYYVYGMVLHVRICLFCFIWFCNMLHTYLSYLKLLTYLSIISCPHFLSIYLPTYLSSFICFYLGYVHLCTYLLLDNTVQVLFLVLSTHRI